MEAQAIEPRWHVVWTTFLSWPPKDSRGDWSLLAQLYAQLSRAGHAVEMSDPLPEAGTGKAPQTGRVALSPEAREALAADLRELARPGGDRLAGDTPIHAMAITAHRVQLVISCPAAALHQKVGRLKSRSATLLSFRPKLGIAGENTWGRGFWWARLEGGEAAAAAIAFVAGR